MRERGDMTFDRERWGCVCLSYGFIGDNIYVGRGTCELMWDRIVGPVESIRPVRLEYFPHPGYDPMRSSRVSTGGDGPVRVFWVYSIGANNYADSVPEHERAEILIAAIGHGIDITFWEGEEE